MSIVVMLFFGDSKSDYLWWHLLFGWWTVKLFVTDFSHAKSCFICSFSYRQIVLKSTNARIPIYYLLLVDLQNILRCL